MKARLVAPVFDEVTPHSYDWSREVLGWLENKGYVVEDLSGSEISRADVEKDIDSVDVFIFYNHGTEDALWGSATEAVIDLKNCGLLAGKTVITMACLAARKLGVELWKLKSVFSGYYDPFSFTTDALAEFKKFANSITFYRLEGMSWKAALEASKELGFALAGKLAQAGKFIASVLMRQNTNALRCYNATAPTETGCNFRAVALKLFGSKGWFISKLRGLSTILFLIGFGVSLHDFCHTLWELGSYKEILSPQGGYIGFAMMLLAFILEFKDFLRSTKS